MQPFRQSLAALLGASAFLGLGACALGWFHAGWTGLVVGVVVWWVAVSLLVAILYRRARVAEKSRP